MLVFALQRVRLAEKAQTAVDVLNHLKPWAAGYIPAFGIWLNSAWDQQPSYGLLFLRAVVAPRGLVAGEGFTDRSELLQLGNGQTTNALTFFRVPVTDFGIAGAFAFTAILGFFTGAIYSRAKQGSAAWAGVLAGAMAAIFWSPNYWFLGYGSRLAALGMAIVTLSVLAKPENREVTLAEQPQQARIGP
jgi:oligosaccharide repeat unit polymerase